MKSLLILFLFILYPLSSFAEIDERKIDVYFANGILTDDGNATANTILIKRAIQKHTYNLDVNKYEKEIGKVAKAYNSTHGFIADLYESLLQKIRREDAFNINDYLPEFLQDAHTRDLKKQVKAYKKSIKDGHKVLVIAHSQGNLFTYEAYRDIDSWMQDYFEAISIATPGHELIKSGTPRISWDNDVVAHTGLYNDLITNPVRITKWVQLSNSTIPPFESPMYTYDFQVPSNTYTDWNRLDFKYDSNVHAFTFYMGEELRNDGKEFILNTLTNQTLKTNFAKNQILAEIKNKLTILNAKPSQYKKITDLGCGCNRRIELAHRFDTTLDANVSDEEVLSFDDKGKLYKVDAQYVKGPYDGDKVLENNASDVCYDLQDSQSNTVAQIGGIGSPGLLKMTLICYNKNWSC